MELTTAAHDLLVFHDGHRVHRYEGLDPGRTYDYLGLESRTLDRPPGELLCRIATVNDVHFGEEECGRVDDHPQGPIQRRAPGETPYPEVMNTAAVLEMQAVEPAAVIVKGDLTNSGQPHEFGAFEAWYRTTFGDRLHVVRGNHDAYEGQHEYAGDRWIEVPGAAIALLDTVIPGKASGTLTTAQLDWLEHHAHASDVPVLVMGHHPQWIDEGDNRRSDDYFGMHPDASDALNDVVARCPRIVAYTAGHTHRHRIRRMTCGVPTIEIGCVKDFPGTWAEYRVFEGGITQVVHRMSTPDALEWSERCRHLYADFGIDYESYALGTLGERCCNIPLR